MPKYLKLSAIIVLSLSLFSCAAGRKAAKVDKHAYMSATYEAVKNAINEADVTLLNDTVRVLFPNHLLFQHGSSEIFQTTYPIMERFAGALNQHQSTDILINGYTDNVGTDETNLKLSQSRADNAKSILVKYAVNAARMYALGFGVKNPIGDNTTEEGRAKNRRVEFIILYTLK